ncbi:MAG: transglycosylase domain-containing protein [Candidatus Ruthia sp.]|nr:transglycosylase domain-containing protein [Candidatus Ruthturnera sp.]MBT6921862.1 transglycosylase domain-containing protein [Candidatus Ruthturnera sp.]
MNKAFIAKWLKRLTLLSVIVFAVYVNHLNNLVRTEFSKPLTLVHSTLSLEQHPKALLNMLLLVEDQSFFKHSGVDFKEIARVLRDYWLHDKPIRGASTLTQQLIKNTLLTREQTLSRKLNEVLMALLLESSFDKDFILNRYMNTVYLAQQGNKAIYGFEKGAQFYFNQSVDALSNEEIATLVALVKGPSYYHPIKHAKRLSKRRQLVLSIYQKFEKIVK